MNNFVIIVVCFFLWLPVCAAEKNQECGPLRKQLEDMIQRRSNGVPELKKSVGIKDALSAIEKIPSFTVEESKEFERLLKVTPAEESNSQLRKLVSPLCGKIRGLTISEALSEAFEKANPQEQKSIQEYFWGIATEDRGVGPTLLELSVEIVILRTAVKHEILKISNNKYALEQIYREVRDFASKASQENQKKAESSADVLKLFPENMNTEYRFVKSIRQKLMGINWKR